MEGELLPIDIICFGLIWAGRVGVSCILSVVMEGTVVDNIGDSVLIKIIKHFKEDIQCV